MNLYEIETGGVGYSYCRCYAWANSEEEAVLLCREKNKTRRLPHDLKAKLLFSADALPFCTLISGDGWDTDEEVLGTEKKA